MKVIDIHTHPKGFSGQGLSCPVEEAVAAALEQMDRCDIVMSGILGHVAPFQTAESVREGNHYTERMVNLHPDRFFGMCFVNPALAESAVREELTRRLESPAFRGIKLELDVNCRSALLDPVMEMAIRHDVPVLHHSWYVNPWTVENDKTQENRSEPHDVADLARRFPEARIIMAHMEGSNVRGILDIADLENVWIDTSGSQPFSGTLEFAVKTLGSRRILFGSDLFLRGLASQLGRILGTPLSPEDRENIFHRNARAVFRLPLEQEDSSAATP
ncbi:MAG: amidohydrolase [Chthoniobacterales bacterium]|nr:amidohydrolase [Chthoniobacterales bacterium]